MSRENPARPSSISWWTVLSALFRDRDYRSILIILIALGLGVGLILPYAALWVTERLNGTPAQAAFLFVPAGIVGIVTTTLAASYSDRVSRRRGVLLLALFVGGASRVGLAFSSTYGIALVLFALTGFSGFAILFAMLRDAIDKKQREGVTAPDQGAFITSLERTGFSFGWLFGPVLGGAAIGLLGYRWLFIVSGLLFLAAGATAWFTLSEQSPHGTRKGSAVRSLSPREVVLLLLLALVGLFLYTGDNGRILFLSLYLTDTLHLTLAMVSWAFSVTVFSELLLMPISGRIADRFGVTRVLLAGIIGEALYFVCLRYSTTYGEVLALQVLYAFVVSSIMGVAIVFAQKMMGADRIGLTTSTYLVSSGLSPLLNGLAVGSTVIAMNLSRMFLFLGLLSCLALALVVVIAKTRSRDAATTS